MTASTRPSSSAPAAPADARKAWTALAREASAVYRGVDMTAWQYARFKLRMDPVFCEIVSQGLIAPNAQVLDIGCGQGVLASLLRASAGWAQQGRWPGEWATAPTGVRVTGIELARRDAQRAHQALGGGIEIVCGDMRTTPFPTCDTVVILDVLHYVSLDDQNEVLARVRRALVPGGRLLLRVGDAAASGRSRYARFIDAVVLLVRGRRTVPQFTRTLPEWIAQLESLGFELRTQAMSQGTPFANVLLIAKVNTREASTEK